MKRKTKPKVSEVLFETLQYFYRMRKYVVAQDIRKPALIWDMQRAIGETWHSDYSPVCRHFATCSDCPLLDKTRRNVRCCNGMWHRLLRSQTWEEFLPALDRIIVFISAKHVEAKAKEG